MYGSTRLPAAEFLNPIRPPHNHQSVSDGYVLISGRIEDHLPIVVNEADDQQTLLFQLRRVLNPVVKLHFCYNLI